MGSAVFFSCLMFSFFCKVDKDPEKKYYDLLRNRLKDSFFAQRYKTKS